AACAGFFRACRRADDILLRSDEEWQAIAPLTGAADGGELERLRDAFRDGVPRGDEGAMRAAAANLYDLLAAIGGETLVGAIGSAVGLAMARWRAVDLLLDGWVVLLLNLPALVIAVLAYVWFGLTEAAAIGAVAVNKLPLVAMTMREGGRSLASELSEMAAV